MVLMRQTYNPILEAGGVDLVLSGHSHNYERSVLLNGNYGTTGTITSAMKKNAGNGSITGFTTGANGVIRNAANSFTATATVNGTVIPADGAYIKPLTGARNNFGTVYNTAGMSGQADGGSLNHSAMYISYNSVGTVNLDINGDTLSATFIQSDGTAPDNYTIVKQGGSTVPIVTTLAATTAAITSSRATLNANVNPTGTPSTAQFEYGTNISYGNTTSVSLSPNNGLVSQSVSANLTDLAPNTNYHYRITATNTWGTSNGSDMMFTTPSTTAFDFWSTSNNVTGANSAPTQNKDSDTLTNLEEYAFGTDPNVSDSTALQLTGSSVAKRGSPIVTVGTNGTTVDPNAVFCRRKDAASVGLTYTVQFSADLTTWSTSTATPTVIADDGEIEVVKVHYPFSVNGRKAQFFHVVITAP
jgi:hypothetical protein